jgi:hypothetical protein
VAVARIAHDPITPLKFDKRVAQCASGKPDLTYDFSKAHARAAMHERKQRDLPTASREVA